MLAAQALIEGIPLVSADAIFDQPPVRFALRGAPRPGMLASMGDGACMAMGLLTIRFAVRDLFVLVAKVGCLLPAMTFVPRRPVEIAVMMVVFTALSAVELAVSSTSSGVAPRFFAVSFFIARLAFAYAVCLSAEMIVLFVDGIRELPATTGVRIAMVLALAIMGWWAFLASLVSILAALMAWRKDRRARWLVYLNAPYVVGIIVYALLMS